MRIVNTFRLCPLLALSALLVVPGPADAASAEKRIDQTLAADPDASIDIETFSGSLEIRGWDRAEVRVVGTLGGDTEGLTFTSEGGSVTIEVEIPDRHSGRRRVDAHLTIDVPRGATIDAETVSASIDVSEIDGEIELESVSGGFEVRGAPRVAELETVSGSIRLSGSATSVDVESVSGSINLTGVADRVEASSVSGRIEVTAGEIRRGTLEAVSGGIEFEGTLASGARLEAESHSGNVTLLLPASTSADFEVSSFSGNITNELGPPAKKEGRYTPEKSLEFSLGDGSAQVSVETFSGNVSLRKR